MLLSYAFVINFADEYFHPHIAVFVNRTARTTTSLGELSGTTTLVMHIQLLPTLHEDLYDVVRNMHDLYLRTL